MLKIPTLLKTKSSKLTVGRVVAFFMKAFGKNDEIEKLCGFLEWQ